MHLQLNSFSSRTLLSQNYPRIIPELSKTWAMKDMGAEMYAKIADSRRRKGARNAMLLRLCVGQP